MSWTDKFAVENTIKLRNDFNINIAVETGTFRGVNAELYSHIFQRVFTVDVNEEYLKQASERLDKYKNVKIFQMNSWEFLRKFIKEYHEMGRTDTIFFYLDAHFYDAKLPKEDRWVVLKELKELEDFKNGVVCIDDFGCGDMGHLKYNGDELNWNLIKAYTTNNFFYYCNNKELCQVYNDKTISELPITIDWGVLDNLQYANSSEEKSKRGKLYITPKKLNLSQYKLVEFDFK